MVVGPVSGASTPFMLAQQKMSYLSFMLLIGLAYFGKVMALPLWGRVAHHAGARRLLWIGGTAIIPVAGLWLAADLFTPWQTTVTLSFPLSTGRVPLTTKSNEGN